MSFLICTGETPALPVPNRWTVSEARTHVSDATSNDYMGVIFSEGNR
jgi:hypothetical protein